MINAKLENVAEKIRKGISLLRVPKRNFFLTNEGIVKGSYLYVCTISKIIYAISNVSLSKMAFHI